MGTQFMRAADQIKSLKQFQRHMNDKTLSGHKQNLNTAVTSSKSDNMVRHVTLCLLKNVHSCADIKASGFALFKF
jgi:hypothetical protein